MITESLFFHPFILILLTSHGEMWKKCRINIFYDHVDICRLKSNFRVNDRFELQIIDGISVQFLVIDAV